jgi:predicted PurR-regulated permease PerM
MDAKVRKEAVAAAIPASASAEPAPDMLLLISRIALIGVFLLILLAAASVARPIVVPVLAAFVVGMTIGGPVDKLKRAGVPPWIVAIAIVGVVLSALLVSAVLLATPVSDWVSKAPGVTALMREKLHILVRPMGALAELSASLNNLGGDKSEVAVDVSRGNIIQSVLTFLTPALSEFILFFGALLFFLLGRTRMKGKLVLSLVDRANRLMTLRIISDVESDLAAYLATTTMINFGVGVCTTAIMWALGVPNAPLWGRSPFSSITSPTSDRR